MLAKNTYSLNGFKHIEGMIYRRGQVGVKAFSLRGKAFPARVVANVESISRQYQINKRGSRRPSKK